MTRPFICQAIAWPFAKLAIARFYVYGLMSFLEFYEVSFARHCGSVVEGSLMAQKVPGLKFAQGQKYHVMRVVHLGKAIYSQMLHSTHLNWMGTGLHVGWRSNRFVV